MIFKTADYVEAYGIRARYARDVHELDGRGGRQALTRFVNQNILDGTSLRPGDRLLDIGCGDGALLSLAAEKGIKQALGLQATEFEATRLRALGLSVSRGLTDSLPVPDASASVVVCNGVLVIVPSERIPASLKEIARAAEPGARIWLGEIPRTPEQEGIPRHKSASAMLWYLLRKRGLRTFLGMCRGLLWRTLRREPIIFNSATLTQFWAEPQDFIQTAAAAGLALVDHFPHQELNHHGVAVVSQTRFDYLFTK